jgi:hypothetical protein
LSQPAWLGDLLDWRGWTPGATGSASAELDFTQPSDTGRASGTRILSLEGARNDLKGCTPAIRLDIYRVYCNPHPKG